MKKQILFILLALTVMPLSFAFSQEATESPSTENVEFQTTLEDLTANSADYYGQQVTIEGTIENLLNVRTFVLGEAVAVDNDQVLVINNTGDEFDFRVMDGQLARLTGTVYPSIDEGGMGQLMSGNTDMSVSTVEPGMMATEEMMTEELAPTALPTMEPGMTDIDQSGRIDFSTMLLPEEYNVYTIIVLDSLDTLTFIEQQ